jgi:hypothetical protein
VTGLHCRTQSAKQGCQPVKGDTVVTEDWQSTVCYEPACDSNMVSPVPGLAGFYAAEAALLRDIGLRFPATASMSRRASSNISEADWPATSAAPPPVANSHPSDPVVLLTEPVWCVFSVQVH